jgi:hypothetical protein
MALDEASFGIQYLNVALHTERGAHDRIPKFLKHCIVLGAAGSDREPKCSVLVKHLSKVKFTSPYLQRLVSFSLSTCREVSAD